jgi:hypothetical protein
VGVAFFGAASMYYYQPSIIADDYILLDMLTTNHAKARVAVSRLLIDPPSAQFDALRSVEADAAKYVCGKVNAKDEAGSYSGRRAFVYTVAIDFARIDDNGRIAQKHVAFSTCPVSEEERDNAPKMGDIARPAITVGNRQKGRPRRRSLDPDNDGVADVARR